MLKCQMIMDAMEMIAPIRLAEEWDNPGLLVGNPAQEVDKVLVALDVSDAVVDYAIQEGAQMIISHHPLIFKPLKKIRTDLPLGARLAKLLSHRIAVLCAHTNLDIAEGGVNDVLAREIGLLKLSSFVVSSQETDGAVNSLGRIGRLPEPFSIEELGAWVKKALPASHVRIVKAGERPVRKVAICGGSGAEFVGKAAFLGADAYITGDIRYHDAQRAVEEGIHLIDAGHFGTEYPIVAVLARRLREELINAKGDVTIIEDRFSKDFFEIVQS